MSLFNSIPGIVEQLIANSKLHIVGYLVLGAIVVLVWPVFWLLLKQIQKLIIFFGTRQRALKAVARLGSGKDLYEGTGVWTHMPLEQPDGYADKVRAAKILAFSNYKGGVGKTTVSANVAACLAKKHNIRVLFIDLDFQDSGSAMAFGKKKWQASDTQSSLAARAISGDLAPSMLNQIAKTAWEADPEDDKTRGRLDVLTSYYDLANADTRVLVEWLLKPRQKRSKSWFEWIGNLYLGKVYKPYDVRYTLAELLHTSHCRNAYDVVIIDCPPRLTSGSIQALCASSHVIFPTLLEWTSAQNVRRYVDQLNLLRKEVCPHLKIIGVVPTRYSDTRASRRALTSLRDLEQQGLLDTGLVDESCFIPMTTQLFEAEIDGIAYINMGDAQRIRPLKIAIENCAELICNRMGL